MPKQKATNEQGGTSGGREGGGTPHSLRYEEVDLRDLVGDEENPNRGQKDGGALLRASMHEFGFVEPGILDRNNKVVHGNQRKDAAVAEGIEKARIIDVDGKSAVYLRFQDLDLSDPDDTRARRLGLMLNTTGMQISLDPARLKDLSSKIDLPAVGISPQALVKMGIRTEPSPSTVEADTGEPEDSPPLWEVSPGQTWKCGNHFVHCGDAARSEAYEHLFEASGIREVDGVVTSPPYAQQRRTDYGGVDEEAYIQWFFGVADNLWNYMADHGSFFLNIKPHSENFQRSLYVMKLVLALCGDPSFTVEEWGVRGRRYALVDELVWRHSGTPGDPWKMGKLKNQWEPVYWFAKSLDYTFRPDRVVRETKDAVLDTAWETSWANDYQGKKSTFEGREVGEGLAYPGNVNYWKERELHGHSAVFPVEMAAFFMRMGGELGSTWLDPFCGSGSALVAAHSCGSQGLGIEKEPNYVATTLKRLHKATGQEPELVGEGA